MSIELYLAINMVADLALLGSVSRALGLFSRRRTLVCAALCAAYAALAATRPVPWASPLAQAATVALASLVVVQPASLQLWATAALSTLCSAALCGGIAAALGLSGPLAMPVCVGIGLALPPLGLTGSSRAQRDWQVSLRVDIAGRTARFLALIDTGNRLREPLSGLPVLIAETSLLRDILPRGGYRVLRFDGMGGSGRMACFRPTAVWIVRGCRKRRAPAVWIALSPGPLPGACRALAPPEFALYR